MAVDNANKRFSILKMGGVLVSPLFIPDGTVNDGDKYHLLNLYFGIALDALVPFVVPDKRSVTADYKGRGLVADYKGRGITV